MYVLSNSASTLRNNRQTIELRDLKKNNLSVICIFFIIAGSIKFNQYIFNKKFKVF